MEVDELRTELLEVIAGKDAEIEQLMHDVCTLRTDVENFTERLDDSDAYERRDTFVMSDDSLPVVSDTENTSEVVCNSIKKNLKIVVKESDISVPHRLGKKNPGQQLNRRSIIIVKLRRRELRSDLISACKSARPKDFYINESLTPLRSTIQYGIRRAKRRFPGKVLAYGSQDGRVYVLTPPPNSEGRKIKTFVNTGDRFNEFCIKTLRCQPADLVVRWPSL